MQRYRIMSLITAIPLIIGFAMPALALTKQEELVERARITIESMLADPQYAALQTNLQTAEAVLIVPSLVKGGFILGGEGGNGVLMARNADGSWTDPSFMVMASGSIGLQIGGEVSELVLSIMTDNGLNAILDHKGRIGADISAALFVVGTGLEAHTGFDTNADMYAFSRGKGLFVGGALEGGVISEKEDWNAAYYGRTAGSREIFSGQHANAQSAALSAALPR